MNVRDAFYKNRQYVITVIKEIISASNLPFKVVELSHFMFSAESVLTAYLTVPIHVTHQPVTCNAHHGPWRNDAFGFYD